ncbi:hypothetical protein V5O48_006752 [Marasmius crinis-equi]|uniref:Uncharacterized protein n=1 Tax=Marasmius crinis-equi TaxID=585013 RepID=A0ABR3FIN9_9AGAR
MSTSEADRDQTVADKEQGVLEQKGEAGDELSQGKVGTEPKSVLQDSKTPESSDAVTHAPQTEAAAEADDAASDEIEEDASDEEPKAPGFKGRGPISYNSSGRPKPSKPTKPR